jgi:hypothetical protein
MSRLLVFALVFALAGETPALAAETLLQSATRVAEAAARAEASPSNAVQTKGDRAAAAERNAEGRTGRLSRGRLQAEQTQPGLEVSGLRKRTKILIGIGAAVGFAAVAYTIDHHVVNNTPSTLGTRKD